MIVSGFIEADELRVGSRVGGRVVEGDSLNKGDPLIIYAISRILPVTCFVEILRGVILRDADVIDLAGYVAGLAACCAVILGLALMRFRKQLG